jgi:spoIIIJ-associated protein
VTAGGNPSNPEPNPGQQDSGVESVREFCREAIACMRLELRVEAASCDDAIVVNFSGPDRAVLLSGSAAVLNSLEYLVNKAFRTGKGEPIPSVVLDSDHYRQHREAELVLLARMASEKVRSLGRPLNLQPMNPRERRIVHLALADVNGVRSESEGEGEHRSVTIYPS